MGKQNKYIEKTCINKGKDKFFKGYTPNYYYKTNEIKLSINKRNEVI